MLTFLSIAPKMCATVDRQPISDTAREKTNIQECFKKR